MSNFDNNDNIFFFLEEKDDDKNNENEIEKMMSEFNQEIGESHVYSWKMNNDEMYFQESNSDELTYFMNKTLYSNDELFYDQEYTVKDLLKICSYYGIDKDIRISKCKKQDIIATIVYFESLPENVEIVKKRNRMWAYITEVINDPKMTKFIIFS